MMEKWYSERWKEQWHIQRRLGNQFIKEFESIQFENTPLCYLSEESILTAKKCKVFLFSYITKLRKIRNVLSRWLKFIYGQETNYTKGEIFTTSFESFFEKY